MKVTLRLAVPVAVALLALAPGRALAQSAEVKRALESASSFYENLDYERALEQLKRAEKKSTGTTDDVLIALYEGVMYSYLGREERASAAFFAGLSRDPDAKLPMEVSPKVEALFERARTRARRQLRETHRTRRESAAAKREGEAEEKRLAEAKAAEERRLAEDKQRAEAEAAEAKRLVEEQQRAEAAEATRRAEAKAAAEENSRAEAKVGSGERPDAQANAASPPSLVPSPSLGTARPAQALTASGPSTPGGSARRLAWIPAAGGAACAVGAGVLLFLAKANYDALDNGTALPFEAIQIREAGKQQQVIGYGLAGVGAAALLTSGAMFLWGGNDARVSVLVAPGQAAVGVAGVLP